MPVDHLTDEQLEPRIVVRASLTTEQAIASMGRLNDMLARVAAADADPTDAASTVGAD